MPTTRPALPRLFGQRASALLTALCTIACAATAQNLVPNPGFETFSTCPVGFSQFNGYVNAWTDPNTATPDYMNACANPFPAGVPRNGTGWQQAHTGTGYAGFYTSAGTLYREFIQAHLTAPLVAGTSYAVKFFVVLHNRSRTAVDDIGAYFSASAPSSAGAGVLNGDPQAQVSNAFGNVITDSLNWTSISGTYLAAGGEQYITIGHFKDDAQTTYVDVNYGTQGAYYYVDDISLTALTALPIELIAFSGHREGTRTRLEWTTASEADNAGFELQRSTDAERFDDVAWVEGHGDAQQEQRYSWIDDNDPNAGTSFYRLKQIDTDGRSTYSEVIAVQGIASEATGLEVLASGEVDVRSPRDATATIEVLNAEGTRQSITTLQLVAGVTRFDPFARSPSTAGVHLVRLLVNDASWSAVVPFTGR